MAQIPAYIDQLVQQANGLLTKERESQVDWLEVYISLMFENADVEYGGHTRLAECLNLTESQYWTRRNAAVLVSQFSFFKDMILAGSTTISVLSIITSKITKENMPAIREFIPHKTKAQVKEFLDRLNPDGSLKSEEEIIRITLTLTPEEMKFLERAQEILSSQGQNCDQKTAVVRSLEDLIEKRDPVRKAERAARRKEKKLAESKQSMPEPGMASEQQSLNEETLCQQRIQPRLNRTETNIDEKEKSAKPVNTATQHIVYLRDNGECQWTWPDGTKCRKRSMLEIDHIEMRCRGGSNDPDNLRLLCREHNQIAADQKLKGNQEWRQSRKHVRE